MGKLARQEGDQPPGAAGRLVRLVSSPRLRLAALATVLVLGSGVALAAGGPGRGDLVALVRGSGAAGPLLFVVLYAALTVLLFPGAVITAAGGALFGIAAGTGLSVVGATAGATAAFLLGRRLGRAEVERIAGPRVEALDGWLRRRGFLAVLYVRLIPIFPFNALNYAAGVTAIGTRDYVLGTLVGIVPGAFAFAALGGSLHDPTSPQFLAAAALVVVLAVGGPLLERRFPRPQP